MAHLAIPGPLRRPKQAVRQPSRTALGLLFEIFGAEAVQCTDFAPVKFLAESERMLVAQILTKRLHSPMTSSAGRLFDAVASLLDLRQRMTFEGQAAMELEAAIQYLGVDISPTIWSRFLQYVYVLDWQPAVEQILTGLRDGEPVGVIAARFHNTLAEMIVAIARRAGEARVVLTGGCFQNQYLAERCIARLTGEGFRPYWHQRVPPNDGGISLGQVVAAAAAMRSAGTPSRKGALTV